MDTEKLVHWTQVFGCYPTPQTEKFEADPQIQFFLDGPVCDALRVYGLSWRQDAMGGIIVEIMSSESGPSLMLMAYAMTHPANRMSDPFSGQLSEDRRRIRGRGLAEQKGALAAAIAATAAAVELPFKGKLTLAISAAGETGRHDAARAVLDAVGNVPDAAIICIGTSGKLALGNKGRLDVEITVKGRAAHSSTPAAGVDAIAGARRVMDQVLALDIGQNAHPGLGKATLAQTSIRSWPEATHTIQDEVRLVFDRRLLPGDDVEEIYASIVSAAELPEPWSVHCSRGPHMYPAEISPDGRLARAVAEGCARQGIATAETFYSSGALDAGLFTQSGKEAAMWGPGDMSLWHSDEESIGVDKLTDGARGYAGLIASYLA